MLTEMETASSLASKSEAPRLTRRLCVVCIAPTCKLQCTDDKDDKKNQAMHACRV